MKNNLEIDIHKLLASRKQIAAIWGIEDVQELRPDLDADQAWEVLRDVDRHQDAELGITWTTIRFAADELYPLPDLSEQAVTV